MLPSGPKKSVRSESVIGVKNSESGGSSPITYTSPRWPINQAYSDFTGVSRSVLITPSESNVYADSFSISNRHEISNCHFQLIFFLNH